MTLPPLKTCPFCGSPARYVYRRLFKEWFISCANVKVCAAKVAWINGLEKHGYQMAYTPEEAARRWNAEFSRQEVERPELVEV